MNKVKTQLNVCQNSCCQFVKEHYDDSSLIGCEEKQSSRDVERIIERAGAI